MNRCTNCNKDTTNPKFCSRSCAARYNNVKYPKRRVEGVCKKCKGPTSRRRVYCSTCYTEDRTVNTDDTIADVIYTKAHKSSAFSVIRARARYVYRNTPKVCSNCGYDKHAEVCHIIPIKDFPLDAKVTEVNDKSNLVLLCPNCHWEFDRGRLTL